MKKIVFVEKEDASTYDPVSSFFANKKNQSASKPPPAKPNPNRMSATKTNPIEKMQKMQKEKPVTGKIGRKGDYVPPKRVPPPAQTIKKDESIYNTGSKRLIKKQSDKETTKEALNSEIESWEKRESPQKTTPVKLEPIERKGQEDPSSSTIANLKRKIKDLEVKQAEYQRLLEQADQKQEKFFKAEQKLSKLQKEHKLCGQESKEIGRRLKQKQQQLKKLYSKDTIPYNKKRQIMLMNQINQLKKTNRELVSRVKNYKGNDLAEMAIQNNKSDILNEYEHTGDDFLGADFSKLESLAYRLIESVQKYTTEKNNEREWAWVQEKKFLIQLSEFAKQMSIQCLQHEFKVPHFNQFSINLFDEVEKYRNKLEPLLSKHDLNLIITEDNIQLINSQHEETETFIQTKQMMISTWQESPKKFKKPSEASAYYLNKLKGHLAIFQSQFQVQNILLAHCLAQLSFTRSWVGKATSSLRQSLTNLSVRLKEIESLANLGESAKESIFMYIQSNLGELQLKVPELQVKLKEVGKIFKNKPSMK